MSSILYAGNILPPIIGGISSPVGLKAASGKLPYNSFEDAQRIALLEEGHPELKAMNSQEKRAFINAKVKELKASFEASGHNQAEAKQKLKILDQKRKIIDFVTEWGRTLKIEKPDESHFRKLRRAVAEGKTVCFGCSDVYAEVPAHDYEKEVFRFAEVFMIEHDWGSAFKNANIDDAALKLPYDLCAFEFKFSGHPVIALATQFCSEIVVTPAVYHEGIWLMVDFVGTINDCQEVGDEGALILMKTIGEQIKAACIALDAEVATADVVREAHVSSHGRNNYQPLKSYHVVRLANRGARALPRSEHTETGRHVRLHFRRGHWRHFEAHKTWIKWMLVGDPDLGFVDKHYKL